MSFDTSDDVTTYNEASFAVIERLAALATLPTACTVERLADDEALDHFAAINFAETLGLSPLSLCLQTWREKIDKKKPGSAGETFTGPRALELVADQHDNEDYALGVMLNPTAGRRKAADVLGVSVLAIDYDKPELPTTWPGNLAPTVINQTSSAPHYHLIWRLDCSMRDMAEAKQLLIRMQRALGADKGAAKVSQPFRLPGSLHRGYPGQPSFRVHTIQATCDQYSLEAIEAAYPPTDDEQPPRTPAKAAAKPERNAWPLPAAKCLPPAVARLESIREALSYYSMTDYSEWIITAGFAVHAACDGSQAGFAIWAEASARALNAASQAELQAKWVSFGKSQGTNAATLFWGAGQRGCDLSALGRRYPSGLPSLDGGNAGHKRRSGAAINAFFERTAATFVRVEGARFSTTLWRGLGHADRDVFDALHRLHDGFNNGRIIASASALAFTSQRDERTVRDSLAALIKVGLVERMRKGGISGRGGASNTYRLADLGAGERASKDTPYPTPPTIVWADLPHMVFVPPATDAPAITKPRARKNPATRRPRKPRATRVSHPTGN
jgi:Primase C terminal 2 (PriCT-2)/RepB DNA-primase from phage plasmid